MYPPRRRLSGRHMLTTALVVILGVVATPLGVHGSATTPRRPFSDAHRLPAAAAARASPPITPSASGFSEVPLTGGLLHKGDYAVAATLGGQPLRLKADTTSGSVVVARAACEYCPAAGAKYDDAASPAAAGAPSQANATVVACADPVCGVSTPGGEPDAGQCAALECSACSAGGACCAPGKPGGCWFARAGHHRAGSGRLGRDVLALAAADGAAAGGVSANVTFGGMDVVEGPFFPDGADGLLGLGLDASACEPSCTRPFAAEVGAGDGGVGLCVNVVGGALTFGGVNESHLAAGASLSWFGVTPIASDDVGQPAVARKWLTPVSPSMRVGNATVDAPKVKAALWTSSTPFVGVSSELFLSIFTELQKAYCDLDEGLCSQRTWFRPQSCVHLPDGVLAGLPNFTFTVGGPDDAAPLDVVLTPEDYLLPYPQGSKLYRCVSLVALNMDARDEQLIFGASVLRRYVSYWDRAGRRLGLGPASGACGSSVPVEKGLLSTDGGDGGGGAAGGSATPGHKLPPAITAESVLGAAANGSGAAAPGAATPTATGGRDGPLAAGAPPSPAAAAACAAHDTCAACAADAAACAYNLRTGVCVARGAAGGSILPYPLCHGRGCVCALAGSGGTAAAVGRLVGALVGLALAVGAVVAVGRWWWRRRRREGGGGADPYAPVLVDDEASDEGFDVLGRLPR